ncbi:MAG: ESX secretion-associated protein EspG [Gordonia sp. (in: high G+C Gram-positive bacteria)]
MTAPIRPVPVVPELEVSAAQFLRLGELGGVGSWPVVLCLWPAGDSAAAAGPALAQADSELIVSGLIGGGEPVTRVAEALAVLARPDAELAIRTFGGAGTRRICVARRGSDHAVAIRDRDRVRFGAVSVTAAADLTALVDRLLRDDRPPMRLSPVSAPSPDLVALLAAADACGDPAGALRVLGVGAGELPAVRAALRSCRARTEIVGHARAGAGIATTPGAVGVLDTDRGRIVLRPSKSPDGTSWTTLTSGTATALRQGVALLVEALPAGRWFP